MVLEMIHKEGDNTSDEVMEYVSDRTYDAESPLCIYPQYILFSVIYSYPTFHVTQPISYSGFGLFETVTSLFIISQYLPCSYILGDNASGAQKQFSSMLKTASKMTDI